MLIDATGHDSVNTDHEPIENKVVDADPHIIDDFDHTNVIPLQSNLNAITIEPAIAKEYLDILGNEAIGPQCDALRAYVFGLTQVAFRSLISRET